MSFLFCLLGYPFFLLYWYCTIPIITGKNIILDFHSIFFLNHDLFTIFFKFCFILLFIYLFLICMILPYNILSSMILVPFSLFFSSFHTPIFFVFVFFFHFFTIYFFRTYIMSKNHEMALKDLFLGDFYIFKIYWKTRGQE